MKKIAWFLLVCILYSFKTNAQSRLCECAHTLSPLLAEDFESFFPPSVIKAKKVTQVKVFISSSQKNTKIKNDTAYQLIDSHYIAEALAFNKDGYAVTGGTFYSGIPGYHYTFKRDGSNRIIQFISEFFDSTGKISSYSKPQITDYTLDGNGNIVKTKKSDYDGKMLPDEKSDYTITEYDKQGWKLKETQHSYYDWLKPPHKFHTTYFTYKNNGNTEIAKSYIDKKPVATTTTNYDDQGKPLTIILFNQAMSKPAYKRVFQYDSSGRLIKYIQTTGGGSECLDQGNFSNEFKYNNEGLLIEQRHKYANTVCVLQFEYK
jgi:hypothetical protein